MGEEESVVTRLPRSRFTGIEASHKLTLGPHEMDLLGEIHKNGGILPFKSLKVSSERRQHLLEAKQNLLERRVIVEFTTKGSTKKLSGPKLLAAVRGESERHLKLAKEGETKELGRPSILKISPNHRDLVEAMLATKRTN